MTIWVAAGYGFPGGSVWRRGTGQEGPTGGLTTAMRAMLRGHFALGRAKHSSSPFVFAFLVAQIGWRGFVVLGRPRLHPNLWVGDLIASMLLFGAAIYIPYLLR